MRYPRCAQSQFRRFSATNVVPNPAQDIAGTTPFHNYYVMLHSQNSPREFPKVVSSPLQKAFQLALASSNGLVNFSWSPQRSFPPLPSSRGEEVYSATAFSGAGGIIELENVSLSDVEEAVRRITGSNQMGQHHDTARPLHIYVCTHGARDCRCGDIGGLVTEAFRKEIGRRELDSIVKLGETGHVGGHKYAANVLIYPMGEWLGYVKPEDVPSILDKVLERRTLDWNSAVAPPLLQTHWRGRMGLDREQQLALATGHLFSNT